MSNMRPELLAEYRESWIEADTASMRSPSDELGSLPIFMRTHSTSPRVGHPLVLPPAV